MYCTTFTPQKIFINFKHTLKFKKIKNIELSNIFYILNVKEFVNYEDQKAFCENNVV